MREDFLILGSEEGDVLALTAVTYSGSALRLHFEPGSSDAAFEAVKVRVNDKTLAEHVPLKRKGRGSLLLEVSLDKAATYGDGFENFFDVSVEIRSLKEGTASDSEDDNINEGSIGCVYDTSRKTAFSISINGRMISREVTEVFNEESREAAETTPLEELLSQLDALPGLGQVKEEIRSSINLNRMQVLRRQRGLTSIEMSMHMVFTGNPGTGKTTLARLLAKIYKEAGILSKGQFVEADRAALISHYIGGTALKVERVVDAAVGGILFIDEAYSLADGHDDKDYGKEAITTLLKKMEDNRNDLIVIVAGYPEKMEKFLDSNPGFRSRFNRFIEFSDYSPDELTDIFMYLCRKYALVPEKQMKGILKEYFRKLVEDKDPYFANGRTVRNIFEQTIVNQANRFEGQEEITDQDLMRLKAEDLPGDVLWKARQCLKTG